MLDPLGHFAALDILRMRLKREVLSGSLADLGAIEGLKAIEAHYPYAVLGSVVDHMLAHTGSHDGEVVILTQAVPIYHEVRDFLLDFRAVREQIEQTANNPLAPGALATYNQARADLAGLLGRYDPLIAAVRSFAWQHLHPAHYLPPHGQATAAPVASWLWRDLATSRRTGALAAQVMSGARASGMPELLAFAAGVMASYLGNAIGSPYLVRGVGGPRRSHPYRDRLAAYSVGAWIRHAGTGMFEFDFDPLKYVPVFGPPAHPTLPAPVSKLLRIALAAAFTSTPSTGLPASSLPDVEAGYVQLVQHWRLLHEFPPLPPPVPVDAALDVRIVNGLTPQDAYRPDPPNDQQQPGPAPQGGDGGNIFDPGPGQPPWFLPRHEDPWDYVKEGCLDLLLLPFFLVRIGFWLGHEATDEEPKSTSTPVLGSSQNKLMVPLTQSDFAAVMSAKDILIAVDGLAQLDWHLQQFASDCLYVMKLSGLIYPDATDFTDAEFRQFVTLPPVPGGFSWPAKGESPSSRYLRLPAGPGEQPAVAAPGFLVGEKPYAFLMGGAGGAASVVDEGFAMFRDELLDQPASPVRSTNLNLDGDRGAGVPCWAPSPGTSVADDPVNVLVLGYADV